MSFYLKIDPRRCKSCELCLEACPKHILILADEKNELGFRTAACAKPDECTGCLACALVCPDAAIEVYKKEEKA